MGLQIQALSVGSLPGFSCAAVTYQRRYFEKAQVALIMFVITGGEYPIVVDTGTGDQEVARKYHHGMGLDRSPDEEPLAALSSIGLDPADVGMVVNTHLHWDHCSNNDLFPNARVLVQKSELAYAVDPLEPNLATYERQPGVFPAWMKALGQTETVDGDVEVLPGISLIHLPGHSPGSQGVLVEGENGRYLLAGDTVNHYTNWEGDERLSHIPSGSFTNLHDYMDSFAKMDRLGATVIPSHDPKVLEHKLFD